jgi:hypothetical protein
VSNLTIDFYNDRIHGAVLNATLEWKVVITQYKAEVKVMTQEDKSDKIFNREFFRTSFNLNRLLRGVYGNFLVRLFFEQLTKSAKYPIKLPIEKVCI